MAYDLVFRGGFVVDGTGGPRRVADVAVSGGRVVEIGEVAGKARREVDAAGLIVAPGIVDLHTHYDAQLHWDPYCTASGWHGTTSVVLANCGFGFAPVRPGMADRYMYMMENTEQVPYQVMKMSMPWTWETFPEWLDHLRALPKGVNVASYFPMNALLSYVVGPDEAKTRACTPAERAEMRRMMHEAMDAGASGFAFSFLGAEGNNHLDHDQSPMPCDVMDPEEAYNLADVLRERGEGVIQVLCELPGMSDHRRYVAEELARRSGRPVIHNITLTSDVNAEQHRSIMRWLDEMTAQGLDIWSQAFSFRKPLEITPLHYNVWDSVPVFRAISQAMTAEAKMALVTDPAYRERLRREYDPVPMAQAGGRLEAYFLIDACGHPKFAAFEGQQLRDIAKATDAAVTDVFLDLLVETDLKVLMVSDDNGARNVATVTELLKHPRVLPGTSDGGAHSKHGNGGFWSTDMIKWLTRETDAWSIEAFHELIARNALAFGLEGRGRIAVGGPADLMIYDHAKIDVAPRHQYEVAQDLPGGDWRKIKRAVGVRFIAVNGEITFEDGVCTGATPGQIISNAGVRSRTAVAAE
jgi:N-acyl-D-aspartate/D-glutamate deacylase